MSIHRHIMLNRYGLAQSTMTGYLYSSVCFDPIITPIVSSIVGSVFGVGTVATQIVSALVTTAIVTGIQMLLAPKPPKPEDGKQPLQQAIPPRHWGVGETRLAGAYMLWEAKAEMLYAVQAIAGHPIDSIKAWYLHDDKVTLTGTLVNPLSNGRYEAPINLYKRLGTASDAPYTPMIDAFSGQGIWTTNHRGDGQASIGMTAKHGSQQDYNKNFPYGAPRVSVVARLAKCWDFRDPAQSPTDPTTWTWTTNPVVQLAWHWCFSEFGHGKDYTKAILPVIDIWKEEADVCDELVPLNGGGTEKRYECSGWDTTENGPKAGTNSILAACDGWICERGDGALLITVGKYRASKVVTLTDADITGHAVQYDVLPEDECNRLVPKFTYPDTDYSTTDTDFFEDTAAQLATGRVLTQEADFRWVTKWRQARRLGIREFRRIRQKRRGTLDVRLSGLNAIYARWIQLSTPKRLPALNGSIVENRRSVVALTKGGFQMDFIEHPSNLEVWNPATDEGQAPPIPPKPDGGVLPTPVVSSLTAQAKSGVVYLSATIAQPSDTDLVPTLRYKVYDPSAPTTSGSWVEQRFNYPLASGSDWILNTGAVPADRQLYVQVAFIAGNGQRSPWSAQQLITTTADPTPPAQIPTASATGGAGQATFNWTAPNSENYSGVILYWNTTNNFATATQVTPPTYGAPGSSGSRVVTGISAGTRYGWAVAINKSGIAAAAKATGSFTVT